MLTLKEFWLRLVKIVMPLILVIGVLFAILITILKFKVKNKEKEKLDAEIENIKIKADLKIEKINFELDCIEEEKEILKKKVSDDAKLKKTIRNLKL